MLNHLRCHGLRTKQHAFEIDVQDALPGGRIGLNNRHGGVGDARIVDQNMDGTIRLIDRRHGLVDDGSLPHVHNNRHRLTASLANRLHGLLGVLRLDIRHRDLRPLLGKQFRCGATNAGAGPGN